MCAQDRVVSTFCRTLAEVSAIPNFSALVNHPVDGFWALSCGQSDGACFDMWKKADQLRNDALVEMASKLDQKDHKILEEMAKAAGYELKPLFSACTPNHSETSLHSPISLRDSPGLAHDGSPENWEPSLECHESSSSPVHTPKKFVKSRAPLSAEPTQRPSTSSGSDASSRKRKMTE